MLHDIAKITSKYTAYPIQYREIHRLIPSYLCHRVRRDLRCPFHLHFTLVVSNYNNIYSLKYQCFVANFANINKSFIFEVLPCNLILPVAVVRGCCHIFSAVVIFSVGVVIFYVAVVTPNLAVAEVRPEIGHKERAAGESLISESP